MPTIHHEISEKEIRDYLAAHVWLYTASVAGKIDVRNYTPKEAT